MSCGGLRIIPARAGPTRSTGKTPWVSSDHPRSCGANLTEEPFVISPSGSSPLVRGQLRDSWKDYAAARIIPARAGPTWSVRRCRCARPDHPRSCGANLSDSELESIRGGSSPLVRGQLGFERGLPAFGRIIPARAGPTTVDLLDARGKADHPRSCGANRHDQIVGILHGGSSPLVRGQHTPYIIGVNKKRIIPARAGPTARRAGESKEQADHPRSCGANAPPGLT